MCVDGISYTPSFYNEINATPQWQLAVMRRSEVMQQLHPELGHGLMINVHFMSSAEVKKTATHAHDGGFERLNLKVTQGHRHMRAIPKMRRENPRLLECADKRAHFLIVGEVARL
jgi:hypothetical protein